ncbi:MAG: hypothetical protein Q9196_005770 [Gyalolechia fulgens]
MADVIKRTDKMSNLPRPILAEGTENRLTKHAPAVIHGAGQDTSRSRKLNRPRPSIEGGRENRPRKPKVDIVDMVVEESPKSRSTFPFLRLPPELRMMVYQHHFHQKPDHRGGMYCLSPKTCGVGQSVCRVAQVNDLVPLQKLWLSCKTVYYEAMPIFFSTRKFEFDNIEHLGQFLATIGPYHRQHLTSIAFDYEKSGSTEAFDVHEAFRLLGECPNLKRLSIHLPSHYIGRKKASLAGLSTLLRIRGIENLDLTFFDPYWISYLYGPDLDNAKKIVAKKIETLKNPYNPAEIKRREAKGITKGAEPRTIFTPKPESRAARISRRQQLKEIA